MAGTAKIILRAIAEPEYRDTLFADFDRAVEGIALDEAERDSLRSLTRQGFERVVGGMMAHMFDPVRASRRVIVIPASQLAVLNPGDVPVRMAPRLAFHNGAHESTQATLAALEAHLHGGDHVLDLGAGTGINSIAAIGLGAGSVLGLDINARAVEAARENIQLNGMVGLVRAEVGTLADVTANRFGPGRARFDVIVANILPSVLLDIIREGIAGLLAPGGRLIVAGMQHEHVAAIGGLLPAAGLEEIDRHTEGAWPVLVLRTKAWHPWNTRRPGLISGMH